MANPCQLLPASHHHPLLLLPSSGIKAIPLCPQYGQMGHSCYLGSAGSGCHGRSPVQKGTKPVRRLCPRQPSGLWARRDSSICSHSCVPRGCIQWVYSLHTESKRPVKLIPYKNFAAPVRIFYCGLPLWLLHTPLFVPNTCLLLLL